MVDEHGASRLNIVANGIAHRADDGTVVLVRPAANGSDVTYVEIDRVLADRYGLSSGDIVEGPTEPIPEIDSPAETARIDTSLDEWEYDERDEPASLRGETVPEWLATRAGPSETLLEIHRVNGLTSEEALERPSARLKRSSFERSAPNRWVEIAISRDDTTGRMLDIAAPLGLGYAGVVLGPHGAGLTRILQAAAHGITLRAPDCLLFVLLIRARGEEITDWRRRFPAAEVVACPWGRHSHGAEDILRVADLTLAAAQRQTEMGREVVLMVDSLTGLWAAMLEEEEADAQREADRAWSRQRIREWLQAAGNFGGEGLLGSGLGGSLTILGSAWRQQIDTEEEEEGESHPHLRLIEHVLSDCDWRVELSGALAADRLFPAIRVSRCLSSREEGFVPKEVLESLREARSIFARFDERSQHIILAEAIEESASLADIVDQLRRGRYNVS